MTGKYPRPAKFRSMGEQLADRIEAREAQLRREGKLVETAKWYQFGLPDIWGTRLFWFGLGMATAYLTGLYLIIPK